MQRIYTDYPAEGKSSPYFDSDNNSRFYLTEAELKKQRSGNSISFKDNPYRNFTSDRTNWRAVLTLYNKNNNRVFSIYYGFDIRNKNVYLYNPEVRYYYKR